MRSRGRSSRPFRVRRAQAAKEHAAGDLVLRASAGEWSPSANRRLPKGRGLAGWVLEHGEAQIVDDIYLDTRWIPTNYDTRSTLIVPLVSKPSVIASDGLGASTSSVLRQSSKLALVGSTSTGRSTPAARMCTR